MHTETNTSRSLTLSLGALGVVFGDIGTSPLYAFKSCFSGYHAMPPTPDNILGVLSLIFWSLLIVVSVKYVIFIMRADNRGEGGIFALYALLQQKLPSKRWVVFSAMLGAALMYGDGFITPAISVLSALEGIRDAAPKAEPLVVPLTSVIIIALFVVQKYGTDKIGRIFGPVMLLWFLCLAVLGLTHTVMHPKVFDALRPYHAVHFFIQNDVTGLIVLGAVVLCVTGGEALYADMGHFGAAPIRQAWYAVVLPALMLNYLGQGALLLEDPQQASNSFYGLVPDPLLYPMIALATMATIIASQAIISGCFSLTNQAIQLGFCPRLNIRHTSAESEGQIYIPQVNYLMLVVCLGLVFGFQRSESLAGAYGIAITGTMIVTSLLFFQLLTKINRWSWWLAAIPVGFFLLFDLGFFGANLLKLQGGGWFPVLAAAIICLVMSIWRSGRKRLETALRPYRLRPETFFEVMEHENPVRVPGTGVYLSMSPNSIPPSVVFTLRTMHALHSKVIILTVLTEEIPRVSPRERMVVKVLQNGFYHVFLRYGFMERPNVHSALTQNASSVGIGSLGQITYFSSRDSIKLVRLSWKSWGMHMFLLMVKNVLSPTSYFNIPHEQVVEYGIPVTIDPKEN